MVRQGNELSLMISFLNYVDFMGKNFKTSITGALYRYLR